MGIVYSKSQGLHYTRVAEVGSLLARANGHKNFRQVRIYHIRDKCVVFARNCIFANLTQYNMQNIPCNSAFLAQETLAVFDSKKHLFCTKISKKCVLIATNLNIGTK